MAGGSRHGAFSLLSSLLLHYVNGRPCDGNSEVVHPWIDTCSFTLVDRFQATFRWMLPVYAGLHFIPPILLRQKAFRKECALRSTE